MNPFDALNPFEAPPSEVEVGGKGVGCCRSSLLPKVLTVIVGTLGVFSLISIPYYFQLLYQQPGISKTPTSFPPSYAFVIGGVFAVCAFVALTLLMIAWSLMEDLRKSKPPQRKKRGGVVKNIQL